MSSRESNRITVEAAVRLLWMGWAGASAHGGFAKHTICAECSESKFCRARRKAGPWYCLDCFEFTAEGRRFAREMFG